MSKDWKISFICMETSLHWHRLFVILYIFCVFPDIISRKMVVVNFRTTHCLLAYFSCSSFHLGLELSEALPSARYWDNSTSHGDLREIIYHAGCNNLENLKISWNLSKFLTKCFKLFIEWFSIFLCYTILFILKGIYKKQYWFQFKHFPIWPGLFNMLH